MRQRSKFVRPRARARAFLAGALATLAQGTVTAYADDLAFRHLDATLETAAGPRKLQVEVAESEAQKALGLMFRTELTDEHGMLFPYGAPQELHMWMHNTLIPLDMVFIRADGVVHRIETRATPMSDRVIDSGGPVVAVLELAGGASVRLGLKAGDKVLYTLSAAH